MFKSILTFVLCIFSLQAFAHAGHIETSEGHSHYIAYGAAVIILAIVLGLVLKFRVRSDV